MNKWKKVRTKDVYRFGKYYDVEVDEVITPGGKIGEYSTVRMKPYVVIIAIDDDELIYFVKQHRYTTDQFTIELPMGNTEGGDALIAAKRELEEEVKVAATNWEKIGEFREANGFADLIGNVFIARDLRKIDNPRLDSLDKDLFEIVKYSINEVRQMIVDGLIDDAATICAIAKAEYLNKF